MPTTCRATAGPRGVGGGPLSSLAAAAWAGVKNGTWTTVPTCIPLSCSSEYDANTSLGLDGFGLRPAMSLQKGLAPEGSLSSEKFELSMLIEWVQPHVGCPFVGLII